MNGPGHRIVPLGADRYLVNGRDGWLVVCANDVYLGRAILTYGEYGQEESRFLAQLLGPGAVVVEGGANLGAHTLSLARAVGRQGRIIAFEPQPALFLDLCAMAALNGLTQVEPRPEGLASAAGVLNVDRVDDLSQPHNSGGHALAAAGAGPSVRVVRLDDVFQGARLDLIKLDIEGMEGDALAGALSTIQRFRPALYVENDRLAQSETLIRQIWAMDYDLWWHAPALYSPNNFFGERANFYGSMISVNMLGLPKARKTNVSGLQPVVDAAWHPVRPAPARPLGGAGEPA